MENKIYGIIYLITNLINGKFYIGQTTQKINIRFRQHCGSTTCIISKAIKKYKKENFKIEQIDIAYNQDQLNLLEGIYISWFKSLTTQNGYNIRAIINGTYRHTDYTKKKLSKLGEKTRGRNHKNAKSKYCGVSINGNSWESFSRQNGKRIRLGSFSSEIEAAQARDIAELNYIGNKAKLNLPELKEQYLKNKIVPQKLDKYHHKKSNSKIRGVSYCNNRKKWIVQKVGLKYKSFTNQSDAEKYVLDFISSFQ